MRGCRGNTIELMCGCVASKSMTCKYTLADLECVQPQIDILRKTGSATVLGCPFAREVVAVTRAEPWKNMF